MDDPAEQEEPQHGGKAELDDCHEKPALNQLAEPRDKETAKRRDHVAGRSLTCHMQILKAEEIVGQADSRGAQARP